MLERGYIILILGAALLISGIIISALWTGYFAGTFIRENIILRDVSIRQSTSVSTSIQIMDTSRPISLTIHVEPSNDMTPSITAVNEGGGQIPNNILRETVRNPKGIIMTSNEFTKQFFTTFKPDIPGKYTITVYNLGNSPVSIGVIVGNIPFVGANNKIVNINFLGAIIAGVVLIIAGIIALIAAVIVLALDRRKILSTTQTTLPQASTTATTKTEKIVLANWIDRFLAWLIDFIIISIALGIIFAAISLPFWIAFPHWFDRITIMNTPSTNLGGPWSPYIISSFVFMAYWTYFESTTGQPIGKRLLNLRTTDLAGRSIDVKTAAIESFGKAFLLPLDVLLGWIFTNDKRQRIFNRASNSIVVKLKEAEEDNDMSKNVTYLKD
ncbi:MAG TPA: RDD family protein [Nitrososphaeraceae archaeon]